MTRKHKERIRDGRVSGDCNFTVPDRVKEIQFPYPAIWKELPVSPRYNCRYESHIEPVVYCSIRNLEVRDAPDARQWQNLEFRGGQIFKLDYEYSIPYKLRLFAFQSNIPIEYGGIPVKKVAQFEEELSNELCSLLEKFTRTSYYVNDRRPEEGIPR